MPDRSTAAPHRVAKPLSSVLIGGAALLLTGCGGKEEPVDTRVPVRTAMVGATASTEGLMGSEPTYSGFIASRVESAVSFRVAGRLVARSVDVGDVVRSGTSLGALDTAPFRLAAQSAQASVASAQAQFAQAEDELARNMPLAADRIVPAAQIERLRAARDTADARLTAARAQLALARDEAGYATLRAPMAGVVTEVAAEPGQYFSPGQVAFRIAQLGGLEAVVDVPETIVGTLRNGMLATIVLSGSGASLGGRVREIAPSADPATRTYRIKVVLSAPAAARMGMSATVTFPEAGSESAPGTTVIRLPSGAVFNRGNQPAVWVVKSQGALELRPVTVAAFENDGVTITSGLRQGDRVVTAGVHRLDARQQVRIWDGRLP